jgi:hypothetical protein
MARDLRDSRTSSVSDYTPSRLPTAHALFLTKLSKHLVLLACRMIVGRTTGQPLLAPMGIFLLIVVAAALHCAGRSLERRLVYRPPPRRSS